MKIQCPKCNEFLEKPSILDAVCISCPNCNKLFEIKNDGTIGRRISTFNKQLSTYLPLGSGITIDNKEYFLTGKLVKRNGNFLWREFIFVSADHQFKYLSEANGHWIIMDEIETSIKIDSSTLSIHYNLNEYRLYDRYSSNIEQAEGAFDFIPVNTFNHDFITDNEIFSTEGTDKERTYFHGTYLDNIQLQSWFPDVVLPPKVGVGIIEPPKINTDNAWIIFCITALLMLFTNYFFNSSNQQTQVLNENLEINSFTKDEFVSKPFTLVGATSPLDVTVRADVSNSWTYAGLTLINTKTKKETYFDSDVEYYYGYEDGESWSEGDKENNFSICNVDPGTYIVKVKLQKDVNDQSTEYAHIYMSWGENNYWNFKIGVLLLIFAGIGIYYYIRYHNEKRWEESDFSPYQSN